MSAEMTHGVPVGRATMAQRTARREAIRRGGLVTGVGVAGDESESHVVVYVTNPSIPTLLSEPFNVWGDVPVVAVKTGVPRLLAGEGGVRNWRV